MPKWKKKRFNLTQICSMIMKAGHWGHQPWAMNLGGWVLRVQKSSSCTAVMPAAAQLQVPSYASKNVHTVLTLKFLICLLQDAINFCWVNQLTITVMQYDPLQSTGHRTTYSTSYIQDTCLGATCRICVLLSFPESEQSPDTGSGSRELLTCESADF